MILLFLPDIKTIRIVSSHEFPYDISALGWARPFHQIFEKGPNLVFDGRRGDRLRFYDCLPSQPLQTLSENGKGRTNNVVARGCDSPS